jgi:hypothetical protein
MTGYMEVTESGASAIGFSILITEIEKAFREQPDLGITGVITVFDHRAGIETVSSGLVMFAGIVCHTVELNLTTQQSI